jgi:hypothetical protein
MENIRALLWHKDYKKGRHSRAAPFLVSPTLTAERGAVRPLMREKNGSPKPYCEELNLRTVEGLGTTVRHGGSHQSARHEAECASPLRFFRFQCQSFLRQLRQGCRCLFHSAYLAYREVAPPVLRRLGDTGGNVAAAQDRAAFGLHLQWQSGFAAPDEAGALVARHARSGCPGTVP